MRSSTISRTRGSRRGSGQADPFLFVALQCDRPQEPGARICLAGSRSIVIGRTRSLNLDGERIGLPDSRISSAHLRLESVLNGWVAEDLGSKNGSFIDGEPLTGPSLVHDGAIIEVGHTFLLFRAALPGPGKPELIQGDQLQPAAPGFATFSPALAAELDRLRAVAASTVPILLRGESGTGKEVLAAAVHRLSGRRGAFQPVNCGALPPHLVESTLFGHKRGAFSGAVEDIPGLVRGADRGTLLLDEVGDLPLPAQAALLRVLQEGEVLPVGAVRPVKVDLRVIAATHRDLDALAAQQRFRPDLLARLAGYTCTLPPLRERREDFSLLVASLLARLGATRATVTPEAARALLRHPWPLNVRELEKCLSSAVVLAEEGSIDVEHLPAAVRSAPALSATGPELERRDELIAHLRAHAGNVTAVARAMGKARTQVQRWLRRFQLDPVSFRR